MTREQWEAERRAAWWVAYCSTRHGLYEAILDENGSRFLLKETDARLLEWEKRFPAPEAAPEEEGGDEDAEHLRKYAERSFNRGLQAGRAEAFERAAKICDDMYARAGAACPAFACAAEIRKEASQCPKGINALKEAR